MQANNVRYVQNLRGTLHMILAKLEAERQALIAQLIVVRKQALALLGRIRALAVPVDEIIPERPCSHRYYRELRKALARPAVKIAGLLPACCDMPYPKFSNRGEYRDTPVDKGEGIYVSKLQKDEKERAEIEAATAALKAKRAAVAALKQAAANV